MILSSLLIAAVVITLVAAVATLVGMCLAKPVQENQPNRPDSAIQE